MTRWTILVIGMTVTILGSVSRADDPPKTLTADERKELKAKWEAMQVAMEKASESGKFDEAAVALFEEGLKVTRRLYNVADYPDGHAELATALNNVGGMYKVLGKYAAAEPLLKDALDMHKRLFKDRDRPDIAQCLNTLALVYKAQGKYAAAEPLLKDALDMHKRLFKNRDHPDVAQCLNNLGALYRVQGKYAAAEPLYQDALDMLRRLVKGDHPYVALAMSNLGSLHMAQGKPSAAEPLLKDALDMRTRLFKDRDHPDVAQNLNNLGLLCRDQGKLTDAESHLKDALDMLRRLVKGDHPHVALTLSNLGLVFIAQNKPSAAEPFLKDALDMYRRLAVEYARVKSEGDALTLAASQLSAHDCYLSVARQRAADHRYDPTTAYSAVWSGKGAIARVFEHRHLRARAADSSAAPPLAQLADARRRRADLVLATPAKAPEARKAQQVELAALDADITKLNRDLADRMPQVARLTKLESATPADLQKALPVDAALVDYVRYTFVEWNDTKPAGKKQKQTTRYLAFVVTKDKVAWVDLDAEATIKPAVETWRKAIDSGKAIPAEVPAKVRELVWAPVRKHLPAKVKTVYVCPDADLCRLPFAALPEDQAGTILLDEFAISVVPHAPFLLDQLWPRQEPKGRPTGVVVMGGVDYDAKADGGPKATDPLLKPDQKLTWDALANTAGEVSGVAAAAEKHKLAVTRLEGEKATTKAVLAGLPKVKVAHFATHGFFADPSFRGVFQLDEKEFEQSRFGERVGRAVNSPLVMTGLVLAGANDPKTPGRGILTGEALVDLDLSGLDLAVLSACETGLGDLGGGGEGVFGLQRAFHYAGARNVVCSLWKVPDKSTAALMKLFYQNLWEKDLPPIEALRQAQLYLYRHPKEIEGLANDFRAGFTTRPTTAKEEDGPADDGKTAHPLKWAAFTLSGLGK